MEVHQATGTKKRARGAPFRPGQVANPNGRPPGPNKFTRQLKEAILQAAEDVGEDGRGKNGLLGFLTREARKADNRGYMTLLGKVLPMTVAFDKNRPLEIVSRIELVKPEASALEPPRDVTPPRAAAPSVVLDGRAVEVPPAPAAPPRVRAPSRSGT